MMDDLDRAREFYGRFLTLWNGADPTLPVLAEARRESARLQ
jgi:hypothetical protein